MSRGRDPRPRYWNPVKTQILSQSLTHCGILGKLFNVFVPYFLTNKIGIIIYIFILLSIISKSSSFRKPKRFSWIFWWQSLTSVLLPLGRNVRHDMDSTWHKYSHWLQRAFPDLIGRCYITCGIWITLPKTWKLLNSEIHLAARVVDKGQWTARTPHFLGLGRLIEWYT